METEKIFELAISGLGLLGGFFGYILSLNIKQNILENNQNLDKRIAEGRLSEEKIIAIVNGKYVRYELFSQSQESYNNKISALKELVESKLEGIQESLDDKIQDIKDRIKN